MERLENLVSGHLIQTALRVLGRAAGGMESAETGAPPKLENVEVLYRRALSLAVKPDSQDARHLERERLVTSFLDTGRAALNLVVANGKAVSLDARQLSGLEAIIRLTGRPSFLVKDRRVSDVPSESEWFGTLTEAAGDSIHRVLCSVGRVNLQNAPAPGYAGTAFMVAPGVLMTNRHVAAQFAHEKGTGRWIIGPGCVPTIDFVGEHQRPPGPPFPITAVLLMHPHEDVDLALLRVESGTNARMPDPLCLGTQEGPITKNKPVYAVGYPAFDSRNDQSEMARIFGTAFGVKRFAPGEIMHGRHWLSSSFRHDCTTLGGNSGSCIVDFNTHQVLGLHFGGSYLEANLALSMPKLRADHNLRDVARLYG